MINPHTNRCALPAQTGLKTAMVVAVSLLFGLVLLSEGIHAGILITTSGGPVYQYSGVSDFVGGGQMGGMRVTVVYDNGDVQSRFWTDEAGGQEGGINRSFATLDWKIEAITSANSSTFGDEDENNSDDGIIESGNEFWEFEVKSEAFGNGRNNIASIILDGSSAGILFDRPGLNGSATGIPYHPVDSPDGGFGDGFPERAHQGYDLFGQLVSQASGEVSTGSWRGRDFYSPEFDNSDEDDVLVTYFGQAGSGGDLFAGIRIDFINGFGDSSFNFGLDTDRVTGLVAVPEPSNLALGAAVLIGLAIRRRSK